MQSEYGARYRDLYERHWWWRARHALVLSEIVQAAPPGGYGDILDVGCGDGLLLDALAPFGEARGLEADANLVSEPMLPRVHIGPLDDTYEAPHPLGLITMLDVLEHIEDDRAALVRAHQIAAPGGVLLITVPAFSALWTHHDAVNHHHRRYRRSVLVPLVESVGFTVESARYFFHWPVAAKLLVKARESMFGVGGEGETVPVAPINAALGALCRLEQTTWGRVPGLPGSSLMVRARA